MRHGAGGGNRAEACAALDSLFSASGWRESMTLSGRITLDVKQYRVQGRFRAETTAGGNLTFEFTGNMAMGGHHEDVVVSFHDDVIYVLDRERGRFYEGHETDELLREGLDIEWDMAELIRRVTSRTPRCDRLGCIEIDRRAPGTASVAGRIDGESFRAKFEAGRIREASWPVVWRGRAEDRLQIDYRWRVSDAERPVLDEVVAMLDGRRWRIILDAE